MTLSKYKSSVLKAIQTTEESPLSTYTPQVVKAVNPTFDANYDPSYDVAFDIPQVQTQPVKQEVRPMTFVSPTETDFTGGFTNTIKPIEPIQNIAPQPLKQPINDFTALPTQEITPQVAKPVETVQNQPFYQSGETDFQPQLKEVKGAIDTVDEATYILQRAGNTLATLPNKISQFLGTTGLKKDQTPTTNTEDQLAKLKALGINTDDLPDDYKKALVETTNLPQTEKFWRDVITYEFVKDRALDIETQYDGKIDDFTKLAGDVSTGVLDMLPQTAMAYFSGGTSAMAYVFADSSSRATKNAIQLGADVDQAKTYGLLMGAIETGTEMLAGGWAGVPSGKFTGLAKEGLLGTFENATLKLAKTELGQKVIKLAYQYLGEGAEEYLSEILGNYANAVIGQEVKGLGEVQEDALYAGLVGTLSAVVGDLQRVASVKVSQKFAQDNVKTVEEMPKEEQLSYVNELMSKTGTKVIVADTYNGQDISNSSGAYDPQTKTVIIPTKAYENENILTLSAVHEFTHTLETSGEYQGIQDSIIDFMKKNGTYAPAVADIVNRYGTKVDVNSEIVADFLQETMFKRVSKTADGFETSTDALVLNSFLKNTKGKNILQKAFSAFLNSHYAGELTTKYDDLMRQYKQAKKDGNIELVQSLEPQLAQVFGQLNLTDKAQYFKSLELAFNSAIDYVGEVAPKEDLQFAKKKSDIVEDNVNETKTRSYQTTAVESGVLNEEQASDINKQIEEGKFEYVVSGDKQALKYADGKIFAGADKAYNEFTSAYDSNKNMTKNDIAVAEGLIKYYADQKQNTKVNELIGMVAELGTSLGQQVQALSLIKKMSPAGQAMVLDKTFARLEEQYRGTKLEQKTDYAIQETSNVKPVELKQAIKEFSTEKDNIENWSEEGDLVAQVNKTQKALNNLAKKRGVDLNAVKVDVETLKNDPSVENLKAVQKEAKKQLDKIIKSLTKSQKTYEGKNIDLAIDPTLRDALINAKTQEEIDTAVENIKVDVASRLPATLGDKIQAWRYLSMLGNPKTHIRNIVSNATFGIVSRAKDTIGVSLEQLLPQEDRTKSLKVSKGIKNFASDIFKQRVNDLTASGKYDITKDIESRKKIFDTKILENARTGNMNLLENEDIYAMGKAFTNVLGQFMTARGYDPKTITDAQLEKAIIYATEQAKIRTFRQNSNVATWLNQIEKQNAATKVIVGSLIPFKKTPINILKTGFEYSPAGLIANIPYGISQVKKGNWTQAQFLDKMAAGLTGSALAGLGALMFSSGYLSIGTDDDKSKKENTFSSNLGGQNYSLKLGDWSVSLDWLSPAIMPLMVGAELSKMTEQKTGKNMLDASGEALANIFNPAFDLTMLQGVSDAFKSFETSGSDQMGNILTTMAANYATQFVPTALSQAAKIVDPNLRTTYAGSGLSGTLETTLNKIKNKIPFASMTNEPVINIKGEEVKQSGDVWLRAIQNLVNPANIKENITDETDKEILRVFEETGKTSVIPSTAPSSFTYDGEKITVEDADKTQYSKTLGNTSYNTLKEVFNDDLYKNLSNDQKADVISGAIEYSSSIAKAELLGSKYINTSLQKMSEAEDNGVSISQYLIMNSKLDTIQSTEDFTRKEQFIADLVYAGYSDDEIYRYLVYVGDYSYTKSDQKYIDILRSVE